MLSVGLADADELLACEIQEPLRRYMWLVPSNDIQCDLDEDIDEEPHVIEQDGEPKVEQEDGVVLRGGPREEVLDRLVAVLDAPPAAVSTHQQLNEMRPLTLSSSTLSFVMNATVSSGFCVEGNNIRFVPARRQLLPDGTGPWNRNLSGL